MKTSLTTSLCAFGATFGLFFSATAANVTLTWDASATWEAGERVVITGFEPKAIRFGTTKSGLTPVQASRLRTSEGRSLSLGIDGYLYYRGTTISVR